MGGIWWGGRAICAVAKFLALAGKAMRGHHEAVGFAIEMDTISIPFELYSYVCIYLHIFHHFTCEDQVEQLRC